MLALALGEYLEIGLLNLNGMRVVILIEKCQQVLQLKLALLIKKGMQPREVNSVLIEIAFTVFDFSLVLAPRFDG